MSFISSWNRWFTICSLSFGGSFTGVGKVGTGFLSPVLVWGTYLASHHCKNPNVLWLTLVIFVTWESCRIKDSNFFIKTYLYLEFCFYYNASHDEVAGLWSFHLYVMVGGRNREGDKGGTCSQRHCVGESTRAKWGFPSYVLAQGGISSVTHFSHLLELTKCCHNWRVGFFKVSKLLVERWQDRFCNNLLYCYFKLC